MRTDSHRDGGQRVRSAPTSAAPTVHKNGRPRRSAPGPAYEWLSAEDRMFLSFEKPNSHMHVGAVLLFDAGPLAAGGSSVDVRRIRQHIGSHLSSIPRYRQRLHRSPIDGQPVWVDDDRFALDAHVRHARLGAPGESAARDLCARIASLPLDRDRPLWETWVIDGLGSGRFALLSKIHHCVVDGVAGADLLTALLSPTPDAQASRAARWMPRPIPPSATLLRDRARWQAYAARIAAQTVRDAMRHPSRARDLGRYAAAIRQAFGLGLRPAADSPFNRPIGPNRRLAWLEVDLAAVKEVKNRLGGTVNDVVLTTVAGALRRFLLSRDPTASPVDLRALVPVNTRTAAEAHALGNHVAAWLMPLPVSEASPLRRFAAIHEVTSGLKGANGAIGAQLLTEAGATLIGMSVRLLEWLRPFNLVITNVPGPPMSLYLAGARLEHAYPLVPLFPNQGLGIAVLSYADRLCWGLNADCHVVPDVDAFASCVRDAFDELASGSSPTVLRPSHNGHARRRPLGH